MQETPWDQYSNYLSLDKILQAQNSKSAAAEDPAHDEMLFIQFHQIYELWFKQILFELDDIQTRFAAKVLSESQMQPILVYLGRIVEIFKQMENMIDVLETMPPQSFLDFRGYLGSASGFQSVQFRQIEIRLGLQRQDRICVFHGQFDDHLNSENKTTIQNTEKQPNLFQQLDLWLSRTPFIHVGKYAFWQEYKTAVQKVFDEKIEAARKLLKPDLLALELQNIHLAQKKFEDIFDADKHKTAKGRWRLSWKSLQAALFIMIYRHEPVLQAPHQLLIRLMDVDELLARWRFRHALMVQRMVGFGNGTGGSSGYEYLMGTVQTHRIFTDLYALSAYLIPSKNIPNIPVEIRNTMDFQYPKAQ